MEEQRGMGPFCIMINIYYTIYYIKLVKIYSRTVIVANLVECFPSMHKAQKFVPQNHINPTWWHKLVIPELGRWR